MVLPQALALGSFLRNRVSEATYSLKEKIYMIQRYKIVRDFRSCFQSCEILQLVTSWEFVNILVCYANARNASSNQVVVIITLIGVSVGVN